MANVIIPFLALAEDVSVSFGLVTLVCVIAFAILRRKF
jgi:hypothetical protein